MMKAQEELIEVLNAVLFMASQQNTLLDDQISLTAPTRELNAARRSFMGSTEKPIPMAAFVKERFKYIAVQRKYIKAQFDALSAYGYFDEHINTA